MRGFRRWIGWLWVLDLGAIGLAEEIDVRPFCGNYTNCGNIIQPLKVRFNQKESFYELGSAYAFAAVIPVFDSVEPLSSVLIRPKFVPRILDGHAVVSYTWDELGFPVDIIVSNDLASREKIFALINDTQFHYGTIGLSVPKLISDFNTNGCLDSLGYAVAKNPGRSTTCFSLVAATADGVEFRSGYLVINSLNKLNPELHAFLGNYYPRSERSTQTDTICPETYEDGQYNVGVDFCSQISFPNNFYRICCCFVDFELCHIHSNPLNKPENQYRCLEGEYDSTEAKPTIKILRDADLQSVKKLYSRCYIQYKITLEQNKDVRMIIISGGIENGTEAFEGVEIPKTDGMHSIPVSNCPIKSSQSTVFGDYNLLYLCTNDFCNHDKFLDRFLMGIYNFTQLCTGVTSLAEYFAGESFKCTNYVDQTAFDEVDYPARRMREIPNRMEYLGTRKEINVFRYEFENTDMLECFKDSKRPIRVVDKYRCYPESPPNDCYAMLGINVPFPECPTFTMSEVRTLNDVEKFLGANNETKLLTRETNRCYAIAMKYEDDGDIVFNLTAGAMDSQPEEQIVRCMTETINSNCTQWSETTGLHKQMDITCCHHSVDPRIELSRWVKAIILPTLPKDIMRFVDSQKQRKICIAFPKPIKSTSGNITNQILCDYGYGDSKMSTKDQQRFEFCRTVQYTPKCQIINPHSDNLHDIIHDNHEVPGMMMSNKLIWPKVEFCCCSGDEEDCEMDMRQWGREIESFLNN